MRHTPHRSPHKRQKVARKDTHTTQTWDVAEWFLFTIISSNFFWIFDFQGPLNFFEDSLSLFSVLSYPLVEYYIGLDFRIFASLRLVRLFCPVGQSCILCSILYSVDQNHNIFELILVVDIIFSKITVLALCCDHS
jgi:hypothetical protein